MADVPRHRDGTVCLQNLQCDYLEEIAPELTAKIMAVIDQVPTISRNELENSIKRIITEWQ